MTATSLFLGWVLLVGGSQAGPEAIPMQSEAACVAAMKVLTGKGTLYYDHGVFCIDTRTGEVQRVSDD